MPDQSGPTGLDAVLGFEYSEVSSDRVVVTWKVSPDHLQPQGIVHGGVYCSVVESAASIGAALWFGGRGTVVGVANQTDFLRAVGDGRLTATATPLHRGRSQQLWLVEIIDDQQRLVARGQVRLQNLAGPAAKASN
ncbi:MAG: thioesterase superfamily protein [Pseudonocardiales bacterium]|nr:thioesterase superfamily protein [Pseudonocardiales bacterium]